MRTLTYALVLAIILFGSLHFLNGGLYAQSHAQILNLVPTGQATHTATKSGTWETAGTWNNGVPGNGAKVVIPSGITVTISSKLSTDVKWIRAEGTLKFDPNVNTRLNVETMIVGMSGKLEIGTSVNPVKDGLTAHIQINSDGDINTSYDPYMVSRGIVVLGQMVTHGFQKLAFSKLAVAPMGGATQLQLEKDPVGWKVGDKIVITGTHWDNEGSYDDNSKNQDEVLEITNINGKIIEFKNLANNGSSLLYNHDGPYPEFRPYVANTTRNIILESENWESGIPVLHRGHVMLHSNNASIYNTGLYGLGRVNKMVLISDPDGNGNGLSNPRARYPLHFHMAGPLDAQSALVSGSVVYNSDGWGFVNHQSHVIFEDNVSFDVKGAHYVSEDGNERGVFRRNIAIKSQGAPREGPNRIAALLGGDDARAQAKDFGSRGLGFWFETPYGILCEDNVFASVELVGGIIYGSSFKGHDPPMLSMDYILPENQPLFEGKTEIKASHAAHRGFYNNEIFNSEGAIEIRGNMRDDMGDDLLEHVGHSKKMQLVNCKAWSLKRFGVHITYAAHVNVENWDIIGNIENPYKRDPILITDPEGAGIYIQKAGRHLSFINNRVEGFETGLRVPQTGHQSYQEKHESPELGASVMIGGHFANNIQHFYPTFGRRGNESNQPFIQPPPFTPWFQIQGNPYFDEVAGNTPPTAAFSYKSAGGFAVRFDGSLSADSEYKVEVTPVLDQNNNNIPAYSWDFGDGTAGWGRYPVHTYACDGDYSVTLSVWDHQGAKSTTTKNITVQGTAFPNIVKDPGFDKTAGETYGTVGWSSAFDENETAWFNTKAANSRWNIGGGRATADNTGTAGGMVQVIYDQDRAYRGNQTLKYDAINSSGAVLKIELWGVKGRWFEISNYSLKDPYYINNYEKASFVKILDHDVPQISSWKTQTVNDIDFKDGFDYIIVRLWTEGDGTKGFDNIHIGNLQYSGSGCNCVLSLSKPSLDFGTEAGNNTVTVNSPENFTVNDDQDWITVSKSGSTVTINVTENTGDNSRSGTVTILGCMNKTIRITQEGTGGTGNPDPNPNPGNCGNGGASYVQSAGEIVIEAENYNGSEQRNDVAQWSTGTTQSGFSGAGYVYIPEGAVNNDIGTVTDNAQLIYNVEFTSAGTYTIWVRRWAPDGAGNSVFAGLSGTPSTEFDNTGDNTAWVWKSLGTVTVSGAGVYTFELIRREDGYLVDKIVVNSGEQPSGTGPDETKCVVTNIGKVAPENRIRIFPNPANNEVTIDLGALMADLVSVELKNYLGQVVSTVQHQKDRQVKLNISEFPQGIYLLEVRTTRGDYIVKKMLKH